LLSDPTRGVDVRAKNEIHKLIETRAADGIAVCLNSSGIDEVLAVAQRIVCMRAGRIVADGPRETFDKARALAMVSSSDEGYRRCCGHPGNNSSWNAISKEQH
jgi:rhamnose transport system ATP-binding protein